MKEETQFKNGDKVYHYLIGWSEYINVDGGVRLFKTSGYLDIPDRDIELLSFTEYTLEGFSQKRLEPVIEQNTVVYYMNGSNWYTGYYSHRSLHNHHIFDCQQKSGNNIATKPVNKLSLTNPLI